MQFVDLKAQQNKIKEKIDKRIKKVLDHGQYIMGLKLMNWKKNFQITLM